MKKSIFIKCSLVLIAAIFLVSGVLIYLYYHSATLIIQIAPIDATITLDNSKHQYKNGIHKTYPRDTVQATITAEGFDSKTIDLSLESGKVTKLLAYLVPQSNNWEFYSQNDNQESLSILLTNNGYNLWDYNKVTNNISSDKDPSANNYLKTLSIKSTTPIQFSICGTPATRSNCDSISISYDYYEECNDALCLSITGRKPKLESNTINAIRNKLQEFNYNLDDYEYFYEQSND